MIKQKEELLGKREDKEKSKSVDEKHKKDLNKEISKIRKSMKEKEKEIIKLRTEISVFKKIDSNAIEKQEKFDHSSKE